MLNNNLRGVEQLERKELFASLVTGVDDPTITPLEDSAISVRFDQIGGLDGGSDAASDGGATNYTFYGRYLASGDVRN